MQGLQRLPLVSLFYAATLVNDGVGRICMCSPAEMFLKRLLFFAEATADIFHFIGALHPSVLPSFHPQDQRRGKKEKKKHLVLIRRELYSPGICVDSFYRRPSFLFGKICADSDSREPRFFFFAPP